MNARSISRSHEARNSPASGEWLSPTKRSPELLVDLAAYRIAATTVSERYVCLLNSTSVVLDEGWLVALHEHVAGAGVGIVGASGSWESHYTQTLGRTVASFASGPGLLRATQAAYRKA